MANEAEQAAAAEAKLDTLVGMGFGRSAAERALKARKGDVGDAVNALVEAGTGGGVCDDPIAFEDTPPEEEPAPASQTPEAEYDDDVSL